MLHAAIIAKAPVNIICDLMGMFAAFKDSNGRYPIYVAVQEGLTWMEGMTEFMKSQNHRSMIDVAAE